MATASDSPHTNSSPDLNTILLRCVRDIDEQKPLQHGIYVSKNEDANETLLRSQNLTGNWKHCPTATLLNLKFDGQYDLAILDMREISSSDAVGQWITRLRDLLARQVLVIVDEDVKLSETGENKVLGLMLSLGFEKLTDVDRYALWKFNILAYKQVPDWLNSKFWANPENWDKYRW